MLQIKQNILGYKVGNISFMKNPIACVNENSCKVDCNNNNYYCTMSILESLDESRAKHISGIARIFIHRLQLKL